MYSSYTHKCNKQNVATTLVCGPNYLINKPLFWPNFEVPILISKAVTRNLCISLIRAKKSGVGHVNKVLLALASALERGTLRRPS